MWGLFRQYYLDPAGDSYIEEEFLGYVETEAEADEYIERYDRASLQTREDYRIIKRKILPLKKEVDPLPNIEQYAREMSEPSMEWEPYFMWLSDETLAQLPLGIETEVA